MINKIEPMDLNCNIFSVYDYDGYSIQELLCTFFDRINSCVDLSNQTFKLADWLVNQGLQENVVIQLTKWLENGTLENIISTQVLKKINDRLTASEGKIEASETRIEELDHDTKANAGKISQNEQDIATNEQGIAENLSSITKINSTIAVFSRRLEGLQKEMANLCLPIGIIIHAYTDDYNPNAIYGKFGQRWTEITGRFLVSKSGDTEFNTTGKLGGEKEVRLTKDEIPSHYHDGLFMDNASTGSGTPNGDGHGTKINIGWHVSGSTSGNNLTFNQPPQQYDRPSGGIITGHTGASQAHNNLPPYQVVRMWKRVE